MTPEDLALTKQFLISPAASAKGLDILNTRVFKKGENSFVITVGSVSTEGNCEMTHDGVTFEIRYGEFAEYCREINAYLRKALPYVANER